MKLKTINPHFWHGKQTGATRSKGEASCVKLHRKSQEVTDTMAANPVNFQNKTPCAEYHFVLTKPTTASYEASYDSWTYACVNSVFLFAKEQK